MRKYLEQKKMERNERSKRIRGGGKNMCYVFFFFPPSSPIWFSLVKLILNTKPGIVFILFHHILFYSIQLLLFFFCYCKSKYNTCIYAMRTMTSKNNHLVEQDKWKFSLQILYQQIFLFKQNESAFVDALITARKQVTVRIFQLNTNFIYL